MTRRRQSDRSGRPEGATGGPEEISAAVVKLSCGAFREVRLQHRGRARLGGFSPGWGDGEVDRVLDGGATGAAHVGRVRVVSDERSEQFMTEGGQGLPTVSPETVRSTWIADNKT